MANSKIQDRAEARRWIEEGRTYRWIVEEYRRKYNIETVPSTWAMFRQREGIPRRIVRDENLVPWAIRQEHRWLNPAAMLRNEARRRAGFDLGDERTHELDTWIATLQSEGVVVHYDPDTDQGFFYVPRRQGIDTDLVRVPDKATGRRNAD